MLNRRVLLIAGSWLVAAVIATVGSIAVIRLVVPDLTGSTGAARSTEDVTRALAQTTPVAAATSRPSPTPTGEPSSASGKKRAISTKGGSFIATCTNGTVTVQNLFAGQGFQLDDGPYGTGKRVEVEFESERLDIRVTVTCDANGIPREKIQQEVDAD
ncbi:hypothetical protein [Sinosporangium siamense]|uniref:Septum formation initiator n=1 Tax=Sinosporangium siamense TaxID=1367973 RepID=A0A919RBW6_9ACTN|nr:hypothetical protein [Sinosporangium siamense]GII89930.1 hypothetical protein Ssi02_01610 [Sinosporangium siamense]